MSGTWAAGRHATHAEETAWYRYNYKVKLVETIEVWALFLNPTEPRIPRRLRKYIGPQSYCNWPDVEARQKMEQAVKDIQAKADLIYNKFKAHFAFQVRF